MVRMVIIMFGQANTLSAVRAVQAVSMGIGIGEQEAFAAGVLPDPVVMTDEPALGWAWRDILQVADDTNGLRLGETLRRDIRSQRKIENGELYFIADNNNVTGTAFSVYLRGIIRCLLGV